MKVQGNRYINNPEMIKNKVEKKTTVPQNIISEDDVKISDSARKLVETARNKVSDFHTMHFSSKSATTSSTGGLVLALKRAFLLLAQKGGIASTFTGPL